MVLVWYQEKELVMSNIDTTSNNLIELAHGAGGAKSWELIKKVRKKLKLKGNWHYQEDDAASFTLGKYKIIFTSDAFIIDPLFFPGGDIGKISTCGTINDLLVMGAEPIGLALSIVIEEGFPENKFLKIIRSINTISQLTKVPIVTGDTKVTEKGKIDKIEITTAGIGLARKIIKNSGAKPGDLIISSGDLGEHTVAVLSQRFNYKTKIKSDSYPFIQEMKKVGKFLTACKDPTRGGLAANIIEIAQKSKVKIILEEKFLPYKKETIALANLLGIDYLTFASEGRFIASVSPNNINKTLRILKKFNSEAKFIGYVEKGKGVFLKTCLGALKPIEMPEGKLIPRIC